MFCLDFQRVDCGWTLSFAWDLPYEQFPLQIQQVTICDSYLKAVAVSFPLRRQTDGYCILPGHRASKQKTSIAVRIPRQLQSKSAYAAFCLVHSAYAPEGIPLEQKKLKAAIIRA